jgi:Ni,Fe-hydrogenase III large subunit/Ni,Fe-hydrogenase III component G
MTTTFGVTGPTDRIAVHLFTALHERLLDLECPTPNRLYATVSAADSVAAVRALYDGLRARYTITVGLDRRSEGQGFEVLHCFALDGEHLRLAVRVPLDAERPVIPSITPFIPGASWAELEIRDLLGIEVAGHPDPRRLVLPDGFPDNVHPLRKDFPYDAKPALDGPSFKFKEAPPGTTVVRIGPFFPVLEEPSQWRLFVDGERIVGTDYRGFYSHRAVEKLAEAVLPYNQIISLAERICGICGCVHSTAYCQAVEEAAGLAVPLRARVVRTLILELERLQSHLLWLGLAGHVLGFDFLFQQSWRVREPLMWLAEFLTGSRKHFQCNVVGGVTFDVPAAKRERILEVLGTLEREAQTLVKALEGDDALVSRLKGVGLFTPEEVRSMGAVGPTARGSGVAVDARRDHPYAAYDQLEFDVVTHQGCDNLGRTMVRVGEMFESAKLMRQCVRLLDELPPGDLVADVPPELPAFREGMHGVEAPRGEVFHYVRTGAKRGPDRWRVRAPSYQNIQAVPLMLKDGTSVADVPITLASVDPCFSCTERMEVVDVAAGTRRVLRRAEIRELVRTGHVPPPPGGTAGEGGA